MDAKELSNYKMNDSESQTWDKFQKRIISDCLQIKVPSSLSEYIKTQTNPTELYTHSAGYCNNVGYYYVTEGDRGELFLQCLSFNIEDIRWYLMERIVTHVGQQLELEHRKNEEKNWRYPRLFKNGRLTYEENESWVYDAVYDSRKYWFEYAISSLAKMFQEERIRPYVASRVDLMNRWFYVPHWDFNWKNTYFFEISDSKEHD